MPSLRGNTAIGNNALGANTTGAENIAIGDGAGEEITAGTSNIDIGNLGVSGDNGVIRIGMQGTQTSTFIAGIFPATTGGAAIPVLVDTNGQLGTISSSRRYKEDIQPMGDASDRLLQLRPVQFRYEKPNANGEKPIQYGLIAEEVQEVLPELVVSNKDGQPETVAYHLLVAQLLKVENSISVDCVVMRGNVNAVTEPPKRRSISSGPCGDRFAIFLNYVGSLKRVEIR
jgi:trimeric autotransporter adhesin